MFVPVIITTNVIKIITLSTVVCSMIPLPPAYPFPLVKDAHQGATGPPWRVAFMLNTSQFFFQSDETQSKGDHHQQPPPRQTGRRRALLPHTLHTPLFHTPPLHMPVTWHPSNTFTCKLTLYPYTYILYSSSPHACHLAPPPTKKKHLHLLTNTTPTHTFIPYSPPHSCHPNPHPQKKHL